MKESMDDELIVITSGSGKSVTLPCSAAAPDAGRYVLEWKKEGSTVYTFMHGEVEGHTMMGYAGRLQHGDSGSLIISPVQINDHGIYWCIIKMFNRPADHPTGRKLKLDVQIPPTFVNPPSSMIFKKVGDPLKLRCDAEGIPIPRVYWTKDGMSVLDETDHLSVESDAVELNFRKLRDTDEGIYRCHATNAEGSRSHDVQILFAKGVYFDSPPQNITALAGNAIAWTCHAKAEPGEVNYEWYFGDKKTVYASSLGLRSTVENGNLSIFPVEKSDTGWFSCQAFNGYGQPAKAKAYLDVQYRPEVVASTPTIQYIPLGMLAHLTCNIDANPPANYVKWTKNGKNLGFDKLDHSSTSVSRHLARLTIKKVVSNDSAPYTCQAFNTIGESNIYEMHAIVAEPPMFTIVPVPKTRRQRGEDVTFFCSGSGDPKPVISWRRVVGNFSERVKYEVERNLIIRNIQPDDHGCYECFVQNTIATLIKQACLYVDNSVPQAPDNVTVEAGAFDVRISWIPGYSERRQNFVFKYREKAPGLTWRTENVSSSTQFILTHLQPDTEYEIVVEPYNDLGKGFSSEILTAKTKDFDFTGNDLPTDVSGITYYPLVLRSTGPKPGPPLNFAVSSKHQMLFFSWEESNRTFGTLYYSLEFAPTEKNVAQKVGFPDNHEPFRKLVEKVNERQIQVNGAVAPLKPGHSYDFRVRAHSIVSKSDPSNTITYTIPGMTPQMALVAGIVGGLLFLIICLILAAIALKFSKSNKRKLSASHDGKFSYANGHLTNASVLLDENHGFATTSKKSDRSGFTNVSTQSRKSSLGDRVKSATKKHLRLSNRTERTNWQYRNSQTSETLDCVDSLRSMCDAGSNTSAIAGQQSSNSEGQQCGKTTGNDTILLNVVKENNEGVHISQANTVCNSINTLLKRFQSDTWKNNEPGANETKVSKNEFEESVEPTSLPVTHLGYAGLFHRTSHYDRDTLLGTINTLRDQRPNPNFGDQYSPSANKLAISYKLKNVKRNSLVDIGSKAHIPDTLVCVASSVQNYENVYCGAICSSEKPSSIKEENDNKPKITSPSSASSGVSSHESVGMRNPISLMFREMYITSGDLQPSEVVDTLDNDIRFQQLREEYRRSQRNENKKFAHPLDLH